MNRVTVFIFIGLVAMIAAVGAIYGYANKSNNTAVKVVPSPSLPSDVQKYTSVESGYSISYPSGWYPHQEGNRTIFTRNAQLNIPEYSEGYALGPQFHIATQSYSELGVTIYEQWIERFVSTLPDPAKEKSEETINGIKMTRVVYSAAAADGDEVVYFYGKDNQLFTINHYPYQPGSEMTRSFEQALATFSVNN